MTLSKALNNASRQQGGGCGGVWVVLPRPLVRKLWERQGQFRKSQAVLEPFVAVLANSRKSVSCYCMGWINLNL
ncbi:hypothetical protein O3P69_013460 [Scylla paramamosain]|uniref:Uncharacterized protein n=1 Tax=Scylla paramamosain TaxID=85552 RepID=A0AAW0SC82_SCYPA